MLSPSISPLLKIAAIIIIIAGIMAAKSIVIPFLLALFITIMVAPLLLWLQDRGIHSSLALITIMGIDLLLAGLLMLLVSSSMHDFSANLPFYEDKMHTLLATLTTFLNANGVSFALEDLKAIINPAGIATATSGMVKGVGSLLADSFVILLLVIFMLLEISIFSKKIEAIHIDASSHIITFLDSVKQYMLIKSLFSFATGVIIYLGLLSIGVDYALLWGVFAFLLNFIPNIGSIIAAVPAVLLALIQLGGFDALLVATLFIVVNIVIGSVIEPKYMGEGLGLSTLVVFISLIFWGWVLGPVGMLLSIPLTIMVKLALQNSPDHQWVAILLDSKV